VVSISSIKKGEPFTTQNIWVKRPGTGKILAEKYNDIIGKTAVADIAADTHLTKEMVNGFEAS
jgi:N-acetylneuraminate synthase